VVWVGVGGCGGCGWVWGRGRGGFTCFSYVYIFMSDPNSHWISRSALQTLRTMVLPIENSEVRGNGMG